jgi:amidase
MADASLIKQTANALVAGLKKGDLTPHDLLDALEARIGEVDGKVNALPTLCFDRARAHADDLMEKPVAQRGRLAGMPVPIKDLADVAGVRSTQGSLIFADHVPEVSDILVSHLEAEGGIVYAKSNTPEFGAGANTFNEVFGATLNPWNTARSAAGSSGGAAVALATGMAWLAHGSDMGGSLRNPASFNSICGMRPSPGRVATSRGSKVDGNLGRKARWRAMWKTWRLLFDAMCGEEPGDPCLQAAARNLVPGSGALRLEAEEGRLLPRSRHHARLTRRWRRSSRLPRAAFEDAGVIVEEAHPDLSEAHECFQVQRALAFATAMKPLLDTHRDKLKPEVIWNIEKGLALSADDVVKAEHQRAAMFQRTLDFFDGYDLLLTPATIVSPYPVEQRYVEQCDGHTFDTYIDWLAIVYAITNVCAPALSIPAGFTGEDLPVGIQIIGRPNCDGQVLAGGKLLESVLNLSGHGAD